MNTDLTEDLEEYASIVKRVLDQRKELSYSFMKKEEDELL